MTSLSNQTTSLVSIQHVIKSIVKSCKSFIYLVILLFSTEIQAQTNRVAITTTSSSCSITINVCEDDTLTLVPQNRPNYTNYKCYLGSVAPAYQITITNATVDIDDNGCRFACFGGK